MGMMLAGLAAGAVLGGVAGWFIARSRVAGELARVADLERSAAEVPVLRQENQSLREERARLEEKNRAESDKAAWLESAKKTLGDTLNAVAAEALKTNSQQYIIQANRDIGSLLTPLKETLNSLDQGVKEIEGKRESAYGALSEQLNAIGKMQGELQSTTGTLANALKSSETLGDWGEMQLRNIVELAGMKEHVDFEEQKGTGEGTPDMVVNLPDGGKIIVDAKTPLTYYSQAGEATEPARRDALMETFTAKVGDQVAKLSGKEYWTKLGPTPEFVVMFIPNEAAVAAAFTRKRTLLEDAMKRKVLIASPVSLLAVLKAAAYGWRQHSAVANVQEIAATGRELYERVATFLGHLKDVGEGLDKAVDRFNKAVGSMKDRLIPGAKRLAELGAEGRELPEPGPVDRRPRDPGGESK